MIAIGGRCGEFEKELGLSSKNFLIKVIYHETVVSEKHGLNDNDRSDI